MQGPLLFFYLHNGLSNPISSSICLILDVRVVCCTVNCSPDQSQQNDLNQTQEWCCSHWQISLITNIIIISLTRVCTKPHSQFIYSSYSYYTSISALGRIAKLSNLSIQRKQYRFILFHKFCYSLYVHKL